jgi:hypothetical protein
MPTQFNVMQDDQDKLFPKLTILNAKAIIAKIANIPIIYTLPFIGKDHKECVNIMIVEVEKSIIAEKATPVVDAKFTDTKG